jgi:phage-related protein
MGLVGAELTRGFTSACGTCAAACLLLGDSSNGLATGFGFSSGFSTGFTDAVFSVCDPVEANVAVAVGIGAAGSGAGVGVCTGVGSLEASDKANSIARINAAAFANRELGFLATKWYTHL